MHWCRYKRGIDGPLQRVHSAKKGDQCATTAYMHRLSHWYPIHLARPAGFASSMIGVPKADRARLFAELVHSADKRPLLLKLIKGCPLPSVPLLQLWHGRW